jgi:ketosteroid isomerase-like protein
MRTLFLIPGLLFALASCTNNKTIPESVIRDEILSKGNDIVRALNEADIKGLYKDFWQSESALFLIDGMKVEGYDQIKSIMEGIPNMRKDLDLTVENEEVYVLSEKIAIHLVEFKERKTLLNDSISEGQGLWTTVFKKIDDEWKVIMVHESHVRE